MLLERFLSWWAGAKRSAARVDAVVGLSLLVLCAAIFAVGAPAMRCFGQDVFLSLDGAWRVLRGQRPAVDFLATLGPAWYLLYAGGLSLTRTASAGIGLSAAFVAVLVAAWSFLLLRRRMTNAPFFLACVMLVLLAAAPFPLGYPPWHSSFAMTYNRYGFAGMGLILLESFLPSGEEHRRAQWTGGLSTGLACALLLFTKISYGLVGIAVSGFSVLLRPRERARVLAMLAGFFAIALPTLAWLRFDIAPVIREYRLLASVRGGEISPRNVLRRLFSDRYEFAPVAILTALALFRPAIPYRRRTMLAIACLVAIGAGALLILGNAQPYGLPLAGIAALLVVDELTRELRASRARQSEIALLLAFSLPAIVMPLCLDGGGLAVALARKAIHPHAGYHMQTPRLAALSFFDDSTDEGETNENGEPLVKFTDEGLDLLRANTRPDESVRGLAGVNPFSYGLGRPPSHGGAVSITDRKVSEAVVPPLRDLIGDVDVMLVPKFVFSEQTSLARVLRRYPELLGRDYEFVVESPNWKLYRRRAAAP
jgi:hypothetical protein